MATHLTEGGYTFSNLVGVGGALRERYSTQHDINRLKRYGRNWELYLGQHWSFTREDGEPLITVNYIAALLDKKISFLLGNDFTVTVPTPLEHLTLPVLQQVWEDSGRQSLNYAICQEGSVTGDAFLLVTVAEATQEQLRFDPLASFRIVIQLLSSHECYPEWDETAPPTRYGRAMKSFQIRKEMLRPKADKPNETEPVTLSITITAADIRVKVGDAPEQVSPNVLGEIPVVHIKNKPSSRTSFGIDDVTDLVPLNREVNEKFTDMSDIINYNAAPITVVIGAKATKLERSPRAVWSGLPEGADVKMLELTSDLTAQANYVERIKKALHEMAGVPETSLGQVQPITGTSGETLHLQMAPLVDERNKKRSMYEPGYEHVNYFILRYAEQFLNLKLPFGICRKCGGKIALFYDVPGDTTENPPEPTDTTDVPQSPQGIERRKCYQMDPDTFDFLDPDEMQVPSMRSHSMGKELTRMTMGQATEEAGIKNPSYWDMAPAAPLDEEELAKVNEGMGATTQSGLKLPAEPEELDLPEVKLEAPDGGEPRIIQEARRVKAVPVECDQHLFLNPYTNYVTFNDTLPKDKATQANLLTAYLTAGIVSKQWAMEQIGIENIKEMQEQIEAEANQQTAQLQQTSQQPPAPEAPQGQDQTQATSTEQAPEDTPSEPSQQ